MLRHPLLLVGVLSLIQAGCLQTIMGAASGPAAIGNAAVSQATQQGTNTMNAIAAETAAAVERTNAIEDIDRILATHPGTAKDSELRAMRDAMAKPAEAAAPIRYGQQPIGIYGPISIIRERRNDRFEQGLTLSTPRRNGILGRPAPAGTLPPQPKGGELLPVMLGPTRLRK